MGFFTKLLGGSVYKVAHAIAQHHRELDGKPESVLAYTLMVMRSNLKTTHQEKKFGSLGYMLAEEKVNNYVDLACAWLWVNAPLASYDYLDARRFADELHKYFVELGIESKFLQGNLKWKNASS